jgi:hypothetical protein
VSELAAAEKTNDSYVCRILRITLLAPEIVQAILNGSGQAPQIAELSSPFPIQWETQRDYFQGLTGPARRAEVSATDRSKHRLVNSR